MIKNFDSGTPMGKNEGMNLNFKNTVQTRGSLSRTSSSHLAPLKPGKNTLKETNVAVYFRSTTQNHNKDVLEMFHALTKTYSVVKNIHGGRR
jgi:hypothetical protein